MHDTLRDDFQERIALESELLHEVGGTRLRELLKLPPPPFLFEGLFRDNAITLISSESHAGKTMLMLAMALALDYQRPLFQRFAPVRGGHDVLFLGGDAPEWDYGQQALKIMLGMGLTPEQRAMCSINGVFREGMKLTDPRFMDWLDRYWRVTRFDTLFLDVLLTFHRANENDNTQMAAVMSILKTIREKYNAAIVIAHHTSKPVGGVAQVGNASARGAGSISGSVDFHFGLRRRGSRIFLKLHKGRGSASDEPLDYVDMVDLATAEVDGEGRTRFGVRLDAPQTLRNGAILALLAEGLTSLREIAARLPAAIPPADGTEWTEDSARKAVDNGLQELRRAKKVVNVERGVWRIV